MNALHVWMKGKTAKNVKFFPENQFSKNWCDMCKFAPLPGPSGMYGSTQGHLPYFLIRFLIFSPRTEPLPLKMSWKIPYRLSLLQTMLWFFIWCKIILSVTNVPRSQSAWSWDALSQIYEKTAVVGMWHYVAIFNQILKFTSSSFRQSDHDISIYCSMFM